MKRYRKLRKPYKIKRKKSILKSRFFWAVIFILALAGGIIYTIFFLSVLQIKEIKVVGNQRLSTEDIRRLIEDESEQKFLLFSTRSIFLIDKKKIISMLSEKFPAIDEISLKKKLPGFLILEIKERKGISCFCQDSSCFLLDRQGIIFEEAGERCFLDLTIRDSRSKDPMRLGERVLEEPLVNSINKIKTTIKESLQIDISEFNVTEIPNRKLTVKTTTGWEIYFNPEGDVDWQLTKLAQVLEKEIPPEKRGNLEYIDLRFGNFAPYRYRD